MEHKVKIQSIEHVTHDVIKIVTDKPAGYSFVPGQATDVAVNKEKWKDELRPFTFTCLPNNHYIEFTIKTYPARQGVTNQLLQLSANDELILHDVFGDIAYKDEGVFIAGGAGITPFIAILRYLAETNQVGNNKLIFSNKTKADIIHEEEFSNLLGKNFINILSEENIPGYPGGHINENFLREQITDISKYVYLCGPPSMMDAVEKMLQNLKFPENRLIKEGF